MDKKSREEIKREIEEMMEDLLQNRYVKCNYIFVQNGSETYCKDISVIDAYMKAYDMSVDENVECYMAALGIKAAAPVFSVVDGTIYYSGQIISTRKY